MIVLVSGGASALVEVLEPTGPDIYVSLQIGDTPVHARLPAGTHLTEGETRNFAIALENTVLFDAESGQALYK